MIITTSLSIIITLACFSTKDTNVLTEAFVSPTLPPIISSSTSTTTTTTTTGRLVRLSRSNEKSSSSTELFVRKVKRGSLASLAPEEGNGSRTGKTLVKQGNSRTSKKDNKSKSSGRTNPTGSNKSKSDGNNDVGISPALAEWMAKQESSGVDKDVIQVVVDEDDADIVSFQKFEDLSSSNVPDAATTGGKSRRIKQSERMELEAERNARVKDIVDRLQDVLAAKDGNITTILQLVQQLLDVKSSSSSTSSVPGSTSFSQLLAGKRRLNYRLAWVGSDDAICHVGTGLHKVALARLQEVFLSCLGKNRIELVEVIRILGPFPNVKNKLQGSAKVTTASINNNNNNNSGNMGTAVTASRATMMKIAMDSMVDGTGKEILAGKEENIRLVDLQILSGDEYAIVAAVPLPKGGMTSSSSLSSSSIARNDPFEDNGKHILVFVKEDDLDTKLDSLRVS